MYHFNKAQFPGAPKAFEVGQARVMSNGDVIVAVHRNHARAIIANPGAGDTKAWPAFRGYAQVRRQIQAENRAGVRGRATDVRHDTGGKFERRATYRTVPEKHRTSWLAEKKNVRKAAQFDAAKDRRAAARIAARAMPGRMV